MSKYDEMSDFEISYLVAKAYTDGDVISASDMFPTDNKNAVQIIYKVGISGEYKDYCNNPADMWPIIVDNGIGIISDNDRSGYYATNGWLHHSGAIHADDFECWHENPLRAAAIVFLMMKDAE